MSTRGATEPALPGLDRWQQFPRLLVLPTGLAAAARQRALPVVILAVAFLYRFIDAGFDNDHFRILSQARQVLVHGEAPVRDFLDPGMFLLIYTTAAVQAIFGYSLFGEALYSTSMLAVSAALTFILARRLSGSVGLSLLVTALAVVLHPRLYQYRVVFPPLLGTLVCWRYLDRRSPSRLATLALVTAVAFLLRHDQGVYLAASCLVALVAVHWRDGYRVLVRRLALFAAVAAVPLMPFVVFLELNGGTLDYFRSASEYVRSEANRGGVLNRPGFVFDWSQPLVVVEQLPRELPRVRVEWSSRVTPELRLELERRYSLTDGVAESGGREGTRWTYGLLDDSSQNLAAMVEDRRVNDTGGIDRASARLKQPPGESWFAALWREIDPRMSVALLPGVLTTANAIAWLYHFFVLVPFAALALLVFRWRVGDSQVPRVLSLAVLCLIAQRALLRDPLQARLGDVGAPTLILAAWVLAHQLRKRSAGRPVNWGRLTLQRGDLARLLLAVVVLAATATSVAIVGRLGATLYSAGVLDGPGGVASGFWETVTQIRTSPPIDAPDGISQARLTLARYVRNCTAPTDRLMVTWFAPEFYYYTDRGFAGGQLFWFDRYHDSPADQERTIDILRRQSVPIIIDRTTRAHTLQAFERVASYVDDNYYLAREGPFGERDVNYRVLIHRQAAPVGVDRQLSLPCFR